MFQAINEIKHEQIKFNERIRKEFNELSEKVDQLMVPESSYWKVCL
jgi:hypothetical protein